MNFQSPMKRALVGEMLGTYLLVLFGTGSVASGGSMGLRSHFGDLRVRAAVWGAP